MDDQIFNPTHVENAKWVEKLIKTYPHETYFMASKPYQVEKDGKPINLIPTHSLIKAIRLVNDVKQPLSGSDKYFVLDNWILAKGAFGEVKNISVRWQIKNEAFDYKTKTTRIAKTTYEDDSMMSSSIEPSLMPTSNGPIQRMSIGEAADEFNLLAKIPYFKIKYDLIDSHHAFTTIMAKVGFESLKKWIKMWRAYPSIMTTNQALGLAIAILDMVDEFHHQYGIVHTDIKPANIRLELVKGQLKPKLIDLGLAYRIDMPVYGKRGHFGYLDPYNINDQDELVDEKSDQYSTMISVMELFGFNTKHIPSHYPSYIYYPKIDYCPLFLDQSDLKVEHRDKLIKVIEEATIAHRNRRGNFESVRDAFRDVLMERLGKTTFHNDLLSKYRESLEHDFKTTKYKSASSLDEFFRNYEAAIALDELITAGSLDKVMPIPLKDVVQIAFHNKQSSGDLFLEIQGTVLSILNRMSIKTIWPDSLVNYYRATVALSEEPMLINANSLSMIAKRIANIRELEDVLVSAVDLPEKPILTNLSLFANADGLPPQQSILSAEIDKIGDCAI
jgi:serine/threonine protein kinase